MDKLKFRQKVYANPELIAPELIDMAAGDPGLQAIVDEARQFNARLGQDLNAVAVPDLLDTRLKNIPLQSGTAAATNDGAFQYFALAACLVMAIGIAMATNLRPTPSAGNLQFGEVVLNHLYIEVREMGEIAAGTMTTPVPSPSTRLVMA
ncbi:MAG: DUF3379 family protein, partial [Gammaproteobacteria bacterium]